MSPTSAPAAPPGPADAVARSGVFFVASYSPYAVGGVGQFMIDLGTRLLRAGVPVSLCFREEPREADVPPRFSAAVAIEVPVPRGSGMRTPLFLLRTARALLRARRRIGVCHVIVPHPMTALATLAAKAFGRPVVATVFAPYPVQGRVLRDLPHRMSERIVLTGSDAVVFECEHTREAFAPAGGEVILNGIDTGYFRPDPERRRAVRTRLGLEPDAVVVLFLGRVTRSKGVDDLLEALRGMAAADRARTVLLLVGPLEDDSPQGGEGTRVVGPVGKDEVLDYYAASDVFVLPSYREGISSSLIEAMACGLPVVASGVGGNLEVVAHERTGYLVRPGDVPALRGALEALVARPEARAAMGRAARAEAEARFDLEAMAAGYVATYERVLARHA